MSIIIDAMRKTSEKEIIIDKDEKGYFGIEYVKHPTPSGCTRILPTYSDNRRFPSQEIAMEKFKEALAQLEN
jgi:hypothetical protein